jgi:hypothetical protein
MLRSLSRTSLGASPVTKQMKLDTQKATKLVRNERPTSRCEGDTAQASTNDNSPSSNFELSATRQRPGTPSPGGTPSGTVRGVGGSKHVCAQRRNRTLQDRRPARIAGVISSRHRKWCTARMRDLKSTRQMGQTLDSTYCFMETMLPQ